MDNQTGNRSTADKYISSDCAAFIASKERPLAVSLVIREMALRAG